MGPSELQGAALTVMLIARAIITALASTQTSETVQETTLRCYFENTARDFPFTRKFLKQSNRRDRLGRYT